MNWDLDDSTVGKRYSANLSWGKGSNHTEVLIILWDDTANNNPLPFKSRVVYNGLMAYDSPDLPDIGQALQWAADKIKQLDTNSPLTYEALIS